MAATRPENTGVEAQRRETIEELFTALETPLLQYALRLTGDRELAEDTVQEAFMKLHAGSEQVREPRRWLYRAVHNLALNHCRKSSKIVPLQKNPDDEKSAADEIADAQLLPDEQIVRLEGIGLVRLTLETLDERSRELVRLKFNEELSYKDISTRTGLTVSNVGFLLHHALKAIADELARTGVVP